MDSIGFIGAGQMARAMARGFVEAGLVRGEQIVAADPAPEALAELARQVPGMQTLADNAGVLATASTVVLAVKPQTMPPVLKELAGVATEAHLVISIAAGVRLATIEQMLAAARVVRVMPNTPCLVRRSASGYCLGRRATRQDAQTVARLLTAVGTAVEVDEKLLDAVTGLSGSGPAFVYRMIEAMADGAVLVGLPREIAAALAAQTVRGAAEMVLATGEHPAVLADRVSSPGGTTIAGLAALEAGGFNAAVIAAVRAATQRSAELGRESGS
jgi:pyrroline-5-carboxylate reductase